MSKIQINIDNKNGTNLGVRPYLILRPETMVEKV